MNKNLNLHAFHKTEPVDPALIYDQHDKAFQKVSAYVVMKDGHIAATVAFKFPKDGAGRLSAYVHFIGLAMVRGSATGYGYDKRSAAVEDAVKSYAPVETPALAGLSSFLTAINEKDGQHWANALRYAGFVVFQVI